MASGSPTRLPLTGAFPDRPDSGWRNSAAGDRAPEANHDEASPWAGSRAGYTFECLELGPGLRIAREFTERAPFDRPVRHPGDQILYPAVVGYKYFAAIVLFPSFLVRMDSPFM